VPGAGRRNEDHRIGRNCAEIETVGRLSSPGLETGRRAMTSKIYSFLTGHGISVTLLQNDEIIFDTSSC
jgi:hypothetical protein